MATYFMEGINLPKRFEKFIDNCIQSLFNNEVYDILIRVTKYVDDKGTYAGFCVGDDEEATVDIATHFKLDCGEECEFVAHELASNIAHELVHAKQFARDQINPVDYVWKHNGSSVDCHDLEYAETPWEVEAYAYESILTDIYWENDYV
jgi:hypothetical protein